MTTSPRVQPGVTPAPPRSDRVKGPRVHPIRKEQQCLLKIYASRHSGRLPAVHLLLVAALAVEVAEAVVGVAAGSTDHRQPTEMARALRD